MPTTPRGFGNNTGARTSVTRIPAAARMTRFYGILPNSVVSIPRREPSPTVRLPRDPQQTGHIP